MNTGTVKEQSKWRQPRLLRRDGPSKTFMLMRRTVCLAILCTIGIVGIIGCTGEPADPLAKNAVLQIRCAITVYDETIWIRNRNLVIVKRPRAPYKYVYGNPIEFYSKSYANCPGPTSSMRELLDETKRFLDRNGKDVRANEAEEQRKLQLWLEDMKDGVLDNAELEEDSLEGTIHWTLSLSYGPVETVPATDVWPEEKRLKHELDYEAVVNERTELPPEFAAILSKYFELFPEIQAMDQLLPENTDAESEVPQLHRAERDDA